MLNRNFKITNSLCLNNTNRNVVHPSISLNPVEEREVSSNVEIFEINSSDECDEIRDRDKFSFAHAWSYIGHDLFTDEESYRINEAARQKRRLNKERENENEYSSRNTKDQTYDRSPDNLYPTFYSLDRSYANDPDYKSYHNRQVNRFTIPNNLANSSTSSDDPNADIELIQCGDVLNNRDYWHDNPDTYNEEIYFAQDHDTDKRTIWIYSYKNKRILSENDYMLTNIPNRESSSGTSSTDELEAEPTKQNKISRIATPIPYIPRLNLNLTSTLPTVTEVTEPIRQSAVNATENDKVVQEKSFINRSVSTAETSTDNIVSPPTIKRFLRATRKLQTPENTDEVVYCEPKVKIITGGEDKDVNSYNNVESERGSVTKKNIYIDCSGEDHVDWESHRLPVEKPRIQITTKPIKGVGITDPIEKLEGNWIGEDRTNEEPTILYDNDASNADNTDQNELNITHVKPESEAHQFFISNLPLLKPAEWNEYMPITDSVPSLELTITTELESTKKSWFKKLFTCVKCLKRNKI